MINEEAKNLRVTNGKAESGGGWQVCQVCRKGWSREERREEGREGRRRGARV